MAPRGGLGVVTPLPRANNRRRRRVGRRGDRGAADARARLEVLLLEAGPDYPRGASEPGRCRATSSTARATRCVGTTGVSATAPPPIASGAPSLWRFRAGGSSAALPRSTPASRCAGSRSTTTSGPRSGCPSGDGTPACPRSSGSRRTSTSKRVALRRGPVPIRRHPPGELTSVAGRVPRSLRGARLPALRRHERPDARAARDRTR